MCVCHVGEDLHTVSCNPGFLNSRSRPTLIATEEAIEGSTPSICRRLSRSGGVDGVLLGRNGDEGALAGDRAESLLRSGDIDEGKVAVLEMEASVQPPTGLALDGNTKPSAITKTVGVGQEDCCGDAFS